MQTRRRGHSDWRTRLKQNAAMRWIAEKQNVAASMIAARTSAAAAGITVLKILIRATA